MIYRFLVHLGVLDNPGVPPEKLMENIKKDTEFIKTYLRIAETICTIAFPEAEALMAAINGTSLLGEILSEDVVQKVQEKLNDPNRKNTTDVTTQTKNDLQEVKKTALRVV